ncbi:hypothetical protein C5167_003909 [Papaver somniferum]|uniref:Uncharacterized protein n=1 Tax=Papaver somniferum TaxID=3469 RepID=A0A4Y7L2Q5_PAPSO|nr:hypothetical protein C5167_003909 [Papaver somniferum]
MGDVEIMMELNREEIEILGCFELLEVVLMTSEDGISMQLWLGCSDEVAAQIEASNEAKLFPLMSGASERAKWRFRKWYQLLQMVELLNCSGDRSVALKEYMKPQLVLENECC